MFTSNLPKNFVVLSSLFLLGIPLISCHSSSKVTQAFSSEARHSPGSFVVNINTASENDLEKIPHVGPVLAGKIVEHRTRYGPFRKPEYLLIVEGVSEARYEEIKQFINTE